MGVVKEHAARRRAIPAGAASLLVIRLGRCRHCPVHDEPHRRLVDPHAECAGCHDHPDVIAEKALQDRAPLGRHHPGMVRRGSHTAFDQHAGETLDESARGRVDDARATGSARTSEVRRAIRDRRGPSHCDNVEPEVRPIKGSHDLPRIRTKAE